LLFWNGAEAERRAIGDVDDDNRDVLFIDEDGGKRVYGIKTKVMYGSSQVISYRMLRCQRKGRRR
jgi:hypothetical protein